MYLSMDNVTENPGASCKLSQSKWYKRPKVGIVFIVLVFTLILELKSRFRNSTENWRIGTVRKVAVGFPACTHSQQNIIRAGSEECESGFSCQSAVQWITSKEAEQNFQAVTHPNCKEPSFRTGPEGPVGTEFGLGTNWAGVGLDDFGSPF